LCFALPSEAVLFSGDHVMGWSTTVVAPPDGSMADYMASLDRLLERPELLPPSPEPDLVTRVTDHVSGMTDRYALRVYRDLFMPREGVL
jgi:glyoxylase-like metal-dependent hydrolase (beta-lactamase superfamily II)